MVVATVGGGQLAFEPSRVQVGAEPKEGEVEADKHGIESQIAPLSGAMLKCKLNQQQTKQRGKPPEQGGDRQDCIYLTKQWATNSAALAATRSSIS